MAETEHITTGQAWRTWKIRCAAGRCDEDSAARLRRFGAVTFSSGLRRYASHIGHHGEPLASADSSEGWHFLETRAHVGRNRAGKRYKDWLFERAGASAGDWVAAMESGAALLMRDVVREHLRHEYSPAFMTSLHRAATGESGGNLTLEDLLPDPRLPGAELEEREWRAWAQQHADELMRGLGEPAQLVLWARARGIGLYDPRLLALANAGKTSIYKIHGETMNAITESIRTAWPGEPPAVLTRAAVLLVDALTERIFMKKSAEKWAARFLNVL